MAITRRVCLTIIFFAHEQNKSLIELRSEVVINLLPIYYNQSQFTKHDDDMNGIVNGER